ncbi:hypothetical protein Tco_0803805 [Tanacetum coccineum]|uniref:Uncharacterized protein n=1 Tax=Tanacetum coccineum TaxID=301880 RepID=A0ABQ5A6P7_9ASTR
MSAKHQLMIKGLADSIASASNLRDIQVRDIVKKVEDYLKTYLPAEMDIRWYREYDLAHLKLVFEFFIYKVWKSVQYGVSKELDTAYWTFLRVGTTFDIFQNIIFLFLNTAY